MYLKGKVGIVTGAGQGIGRGIAGLFSALGAFTYLLDLDERRVNEAVTEISMNGFGAKSLIGSVTDPQFLHDAVETILRDNGKIDILVNNAGIIRDNFIDNISEKDWDDVISINLKGSFLVSKAVIPTMKKQKFGKIVNIISRAWLGNIGQSNYSASKGGLVSLTRTLALELARYDINVNGVAPGLIDTPMTQKLSDKVRERLINMQPTRKMGTIRDIAEAVSFLASDRANFITGQVLHVDGGKSCGLISL